MSEQRGPAAGRRPPRSRSGLAGDSPLLGGPLAEPEPDAYDARADPLELPAAVAASERPADLRELRRLVGEPRLAGRRPLAVGEPRLAGRRPLAVPPAEPGRAVDDWGRSQRVFDLVEPLLDFYYRHWFRVETEGIEHVPARSAALLVSNHSGALPPDAPMIMQAIRHEHPAPRPLYMLGEHWFKGYPALGMLANKMGLVAAHPGNAQRLLGDEGRLVLVFPEGQKGSRKVFWQRYRLRRFGRGGFVRTAMRAGAPIVPVAVMGAEEAMPIFAHVPLVQRLTGLIYFPVNHAFPQFGLAAALMYLPAKFRIRFLEPVDLSGYGAQDAEDVALVQEVAERIRGDIQRELDAMTAARRSVWFG